MSNKSKSKKSNVKSKELKELPIPMKFNPGTMKYEPDLPYVKPKNNSKSNTDQKTIMRVNWKTMIIALLIIAILLVIFVFSLIGYL